MNKFGSSGIVNYKISYIYLIILELNWLIFLKNMKEKNILWDLKYFNKIDGKKLKKKMNATDNNLLIELLQQKLEHNKMMKMYL